MLLNYIHLSAPSYSIFRRRITQFRRPVTVFFGVELQNRPKSTNLTGAQSGILLFNILENFLFVAFLPKYLFAFLFGPEPQCFDRGNHAWVKSSKTEIMAYLKGAFNYYDGVYSGFTDARLK
jgi:hypothetical protein